MPTPVRDNWRARFSQDDIVGAAAFHRSLRMARGLRNVSTLSKAMGQGDEEMEAALQEVLVAEQIWEDFGDFGPWTVAAYRQAQGRI